MTDNGKNFFIKDSQLKEILKQELDELLKEVELPDPVNVGNKPDEDWRLIPQPGARNAADQPRTRPSDAPGWEKIALAVTLGLLPPMFVLPQIIAKELRGVGTSEL